ncbi:hypothetical protein L2755_12990 [Shewanella abyssi]|uniref:hypothetical protein n=1 Tax=Shewanella abyssi TaxID=311789 RepID=UPI0020109B00|nr:hypothetical protein [Shewanella abyssi]MCL1050536.1 hypothetical protein [Shewanella abyssi]
MSGTFMPKAHGWIACGFMSGTFMPKAHGWIACGFMSGVHPDMQVVSHQSNFV